ncbi:hypothetical protein ID853_18000 [Xenorhabdus sp. Vera]|uniref:phage tail fiber protein n=1 Tax=Xenorhabdus koppenhoeferi TaxID=351659 RepID=UPI0019BD3B41|nr:hypothetical protein [Xenorhabdus sp. Vera]MBD2812714.1 hypothetical protein [Xenorhabdus sp. Vera]
MFYSQGAISTVSGSAIVRGTGTRFKANINGVAPAQFILIQSGDGNLLHMIQAVNSDTELVLVDKARETLRNVTYQIQTTVPDSIGDAVRHLVAINSYIVNFLQNMDKWMSQNGTVNVTLPNGQTVPLQSIRALQAAMLDKNKNGADIPNKQEFVKNIGLGNALKIGDYGVGTSPIARPQAANIADANQLVTAGWYGAGGHGAQNYWANYAPVMVMTRNGGDDNTGRVAQLQIDSVGMAARFRNDNKWSGWISFYNTGNTTKDINGFLRASSPIIQISPDGTFTTNDESEGATVAKLGTGHYQITNVLGYNADKAWGVHGGISSPKNNNGLELIYIDDKVSKDGSITLETFHRQHSHLPERFQNKRIKAIVDGEKVYYADGEPCDIPEGCRLDVRVQMPEDSVWNVRGRDQDDKSGTDLGQALKDNYG